MTDKQINLLKNGYRIALEQLEAEKKRREWFERMYNLAIGEVGRWRTQDSLRQQKSD